MLAKMGVPLRKKSIEQYWTLFCWRKTPEFRGKELQAVWHHQHATCFKCNRGGNWPLFILLVLQKSSKAHTKNKESRLKRDAEFSEAAKRYIKPNQTNHVFSRTHQLTQRWEHQDLAAVPNVFPKITRRPHCDRLYRSDDSATHGNSARLSNLGRTLGSTPLSPLLCG